MPIAPHNSELTVLYTGTSRPTVERAGLRILHRPMLKIAPFDFDHAKTRRLVASAQTLVFYSPNAVTQLAESGALTGTELEHKRSWAVGEQTAKSLLSHFGVYAAVPQEPHFKGLLANFNAHRPALPLVAFGLKDSPRSLLGAASGRFPQVDATRVHEVPIYQSAAQHYPDLSDLIQSARVRWVTLTSPRGVDAFVSHLTPHELAGLRLAAIGPTTADAVRQHGLHLDLLAATPDRNAMMLEILRAAPNASETHT